jgi:hypothetical protein
MQRNLIPPNIPSTQKVIHRQIQMTTANQTQIGGNHYKAKSIQPWDYIAANQLGYFEGNIIKYVSRWKDKGGVNDLRKARHYLDKLIEMQVNLNDNAQ